MIADNCSHRIYNFYNEILKNINNKISINTSIINEKVAKYVYERRTVKPLYYEQHQ
jgi:hypothetical protein